MELGVVRDGEASGDLMVLVVQGNGGNSLDGLGHLAVHLCLLQVCVLG
mgnify:CR=1 FL=1